MTVTRSAPCRCAARRASSRSVASLSAGCWSTRLPAARAASSVAGCTESKSPTTRSAWRPSARTCSSPESAAITNASTGNASCQRASTGSPPANTSTSIVTPGVGRAGRLRERWRCSLRRHDPDQVLTVGGCVPPSQPGAPDSRVERRRPYPFRCEKASLRRAELTPKRGPSGGEGGEGGVDEEADADRDGALVDVERARVEVAAGLVRVGVVHAEPHVRARDLLRVPGEVVTARALLGGDDGIRTERAGRRGRHQLGRPLVVDDRGHTAVVAELVGRAGRTDERR